MSDPITFKVTTTTYKRAWGVETLWTGWRRFFGFGVVLNVLAPAATIWLCGWDIRLGRIPHRVETDWASWDDVEAAKPEGE